jgi:hypothetical protein
LQFVAAANCSKSSRSKHVQVSARRNCRDRHCRLVSSSSSRSFARTDLPVNSLHEFIAYAKANQGKMQFGSAGFGSGSHLACARVNAAIGAEPTRLGEGH